MVKKVDYETVCDLGRGEINMMNGQQPIIILREGTTRETGKGAQANNITAARAISESMKSPLVQREWIRCLWTQWVMS